MLLNWVVLEFEIWTEMRCHLIGNMCRWHQGGRSLGRMAGGIANVTGRSARPTAEINRLYKGNGCYEMEGIGNDVE